MEIMNTQEKAIYLMELFKVPLLNENKKIGNFSLWWNDKRMDEWRWKNYKTKQL